jgi:hypothetical protein
MVVPFRTFAVFSLAFGMLAAGYLLKPAPAATQSSPLPAPQAAAVDPAPKAAQPTLVANRPPVPLVRPQPTRYFTTTHQDGASSDKPTVDMGTIDSNPPDPAQAQTAALATDQASPEDADAKRAIEFDGYKNVHAVVKGSDGVWHARAMRGHTEIAVRVDASGNVSAE